jgi:hypothetical protein
MTYTEFVSGFRAAYEHRGGLKMFPCGRLDPRWLEQIRSEVNWIIKHHEASNVSARDHFTNWTRPRGEARQFSLLNATGNTKDYSSDHSFELEGKKLVFPHLEGIARFAGLFGDQLINLRLNGLGHNSGLGAHEERPIQAMPMGTKYKIRFHLPIYTNPSARICLDGEKFHFEEGVLYFFNQGCVHAAINDGEEPRYHLVLDCLLSKDLHDRLLSQDNRKSPDAGLVRLNAQETVQYHKPEVWQIDDFVTESGRVMKRLDYGRKSPSWIDYHLTNRPGLYPLVGWLFGRSADKAEL